MQDADYFDFIWPRLVIVDVVVFRADAAAAGKQIVTRLTYERMVAD